MSKKVLVTGASGFVGSFISKELINRGYRVIGVDSMTDYYSPELKALRLVKLKENSLFSFYNLDIASHSQICELFDSNEFSGVIHLAAQAGVRLPLAQINRYIHSNIVGFHNVLQKTLELGVNSFVYASSSSVYGDISPLPYSEKSKLLSPKSFYGATKLNNELEASIVGKEFNTSIRGVRFFTVYGPWGRPDMAYFRLMATALGESEFTLFGDGSVQRDFTYIDDVTTTTIDLFEELESSSELRNDLVNIGGKRPLSMQYLIDEIGRVANRNFQLLHSESNLSDSKITMADNTYLTELLGPREFTPLETGLQRFYEWMNKPEILSQVKKWIKSSI